MKVSSSWQKKFMRHFQGEKNRGFDQPDQQKKIPVLDGIGNILSGRLPFWQSSIIVPSGLRRAVYTKVPKHDLSIHPHAHLLPPTLENNRIH
jgi:hypothetical protein